MIRKYLSTFHFFFAALSSLAIQPVAAEVACVAEVSYRWVKEQPGSTNVDPGAAAPSASSTDKGAARAVGDTGTALAPQTPLPTEASPAAAAVTTRPGERQVRFATVERRGKDEGSVKAGLLVEVNRQKTRAYERCRRDHESFGDCVSTKMSTRSSTLNSLSFSARSKVEEALIEECRVQQGRCVAIESSEPSCRQLVSAAEPTVAPPSGASVGGDESAKSGDSEGKGAEKAGGKAPDVAVDKSKQTKKK